MALSIDGTGNGTIGNLSATTETGNILSTASTVAPKVPVFRARQLDSVAQLISSGTNTKILFATEDFDTASFYDPSTSRFTPTVAGKYFIYATVNGGSDSNNDINDLRCYLYKNGSSVTLNDNAPNTNFRRMGLNVYASLDMNGSTDYVEIYFLSNISSGQARYESGGRFGAYRIGVE